ncbi:hypothetical protein AAF143_06000 [Cyanobium sp. ATX-6F1]
MLVGAGVALDKEWVVANWDRMARDIKLPNAKSWNTDIYKTNETTDPLTPQPSNYKSFRDLVKAE